MLLWIVLICTVVPFIVWKIGDAKRDRHQMVAGLVFDKFRGTERFMSACREALASVPGEMSQGDFETAAKDWQKSFRIQAGSYLQQKYSAAQLSQMLGVLKNVESKETLEKTVPGFASHINKIADENAENLLRRLRPNDKDDREVMGRRRRRR